MDFDQYVAARRSRLVEEAVARGCAADEADTVVDRVLDSHRREIARTEDPHPLLVEALRRELSGEGEVRRATLLTLLPVGALALVVGLVAAAVLLGGKGDDSDNPSPGPPTGFPTVGRSVSPSPRTVMPLLLGYDDRQALASLDRLGLVASSEQQAACVPQGLVIGSRPTPGAPVRTGDQVTITSATSPVTAQCSRDQLASNSTAWEFVRYVIGRGPAPAFTDEVHVVINGEDPATLSRDAASTNGLSGLSQFFNGFSGIGAVSDQGIYPELTALRLTPPTSRCGLGRASVFGARPALNITLESLDLGDDDVCALTVDLYMTGQRIDGIALYQPPDAR